MEGGRFKSNGNVRVYFVLASACRCFPCRSANQMFQNLGEALSRAHRRTSAGTKGQRCDTHRRQPVRFQSVRRPHRHPKQQWCPLTLKHTVLNLLRIAPEADRLKGCKHDAHFVLELLADVHSTCHVPLILTIKHTEQAWPMAKHPREYDALTRNFSPIRPSSSSFARGSLFRLHPCPRTAATVTALPHSDPESTSGTVRLACRCTCG